MQLSAFVAAFEANGPGAVGDDMDRGIKLMDTYAVRFADVEAQRQELMKAEKLFDLPVSDYADFLRVQREFEAMHVLYKLYKQQKIARENWSRTLWAHLDPSALTDGMDHFMKEFRKIPKWVRNGGERCECWRCVALLSLYDSASGAVSVLWCVYAIRRISL